MQYRASNKNHTRAGVLQRQSAQVRTPNNKNKNADPGWISRLGEGVFY